MAAARVSVVVPVYNVLPYLRECLDSILQQSLDDFELIIVDDGSTDGSSGVCDSYGATDPRIMVIHQANQGLSAARNAGITAARGEYITFIDSDDHVDPHYLKTLVGAADDDGADMAIAAAVKFWPTPGKAPVEVSLPRGTYTHHAILESTFYYRLLPSAWAKLIRRAILGDIRFPEGALYEDLYPTTELALRCGKIVVTEARYYYRMRDDSIAHQKYEPRQMDNVDQAMAVEQLVGGTSPGLKAAARHLVTSCAFNTLRKLAGTTDYGSDRSRVQRVVRQRRLRVIFDRSARVKCRVACALTYLGFGVLDRLYKYFVSI